MAQQGWVKIHRKMRECWLWEEKEPFDKRSAWIDLLLSANHADKKTLINNNLTEVKRGSFITSEVKLSERWKWDRGKVRRFLKLLESDNMLRKETTKRLYITISITNYETYQSATSESVENTKVEGNDTTSNEQADNKEETSNEQATNINKNDKNSKNEKKNIFLSDSNEYRLADYLRKHILKNNPSAKVPNDEKIQSWCKVFDYILRIDNRKVDDVKEHIRFSQTDSFWMGNILSPTSLRKQYDKLTMQMKGSVNNEPGSNYKQNTKTGQGKWAGFKPKAIDTKGIDMSDPDIM